VVETEGPKSDLVAPVWLDSDSTGPLSVSDKLSAGIMFIVLMTTFHKLKDKHFQ
jgi:hypothetical protein